jgi:hypothetical protein
MYEDPGHVTRRGQVLLMGGDEVYPHASAEAYQKRLRDPYGWAFPDPHPKLLKGPPVYAVPGNHDWYDGLVLFLALFSRQEHLHLGGWRSHQRRSYFALQLTEAWWIWAMDAQLDDTVDQPQKDYFAAIATERQHHPVWTGAWLALHAQAGQQVLQRHRLCRLARGESVQGRPDPNRSLR